MSYKILNVKLELIQLKLKLNSLIFIFIFFIYTIIPIINFSVHNTFPFKNFTITLHFSTTLTSTPFLTSGEKNNQEAVTTTNPMVNGLATAQCNQHPLTQPITHFFSPKNSTTKHTPWIRKKHMSSSVPTWEPHVWRRTIATRSRMRPLETMKAAHTAGKWVHFCFSCLNNTFSKADVQVNLYIMWRSRTLLTKVLIFFHLLSLKSYPRNLVMKLKSKGSSMIQRWF